MKKRAAKSNEATGAIIDEVSSHLSEGVVAKLPSRDTLLRSMQRARAAKRIPFPTPQSRREMIIPESYTVTSKGEAFLMHDSGGVNRFLIFSTQENLQFLAECEVWLGDGTFTSVPSIFMQLYTIHGLRANKILPLIYVLAPNKTERLYTKIMRWLMKQDLPFNPRRFIIDFELAVISALETCFPNVEISGYLFHFGQCMWRKVQACGLQSRYSRNSEFAVHIKMIIALAFVPMGDVVAVYKALIGSEYFMQHANDLKDIVRYFEETYIGKDVRGRRHSPRIPVSIWNCHASVLADEPRTNNAVEGWHNAFNRRIRIAHASMGQFIDALKREQSATEVVIVQIRAGCEVARPRRRVYRDYDARLKRVVVEYDSENALEYLRNIAYNINL